MKNLLLLVLSAALLGGLLESCKGGAKTQKTLNGFEVNFITDQAGDPAKEGDYVYFRYHVKSKDSLIFSSSMQTPVIKFKLPKIEKAEPKNAQPITEALSLMSKGDSTVVYQVLDEEMKKNINIPGVEKLEFHVFLEDIKDEAAYKAEMDAEQAVLAEKAKVLQEQAVAIGEKAKSILADYKAKKLDASIITTPSGLKYLIHEAGNGPKMKAGKPATVNYYGMLMDGTRFDDSWSRGQAFTFPLGQGQVIKGWDEGVSNLNAGAKATLFIPSDLAYGKDGSPPVIPGDSELMFYIEVEEVK